MAVIYGHCIDFLFVRNYKVSQTELHKQHYNKRVKQIDMKQCVIFETLIQNIKCLEANKTYQHNIPEILKALKITLKQLSLRGKRKHSFSLLTFCEVPSVEGKV